MRTHVKVLGVLQLIFGGFSLLLALGSGMGMGLLSAIVGGSGDPDAATGSAVLGVVGVALSVFFGLVGAVGVACGIGLLTFKSWGRVLGIIASALSLFNLPVGTALGIYGLWVLFNKETEALFKSGGAEGFTNPS